MTTISTCSPTAVVGRILKVNAAPVGSPWMWTLAFGYHRDRAPNHGYAATRKKEDFSSDCFGVDLAAANANAILCCYLAPHYRVSQKRSYHSSLIVMT